ncbi:uncharacterized protein LOC143182681 [Calliopsis andreniformis]|uniref:uncharacterized protein LOC143182681 n=1 Tax=Calliopsis andreniformis TaxID=337506 RepID=UPI003FCE5FA4
MDDDTCHLCPRSHVDRTNCTITTCIWPLLNIERHKTCQVYSPRIEPVKAIRFKQPVNALRGYGPCTNLMYRPIVQGGFSYRGVDKLVPLGLPPNSPVLCRPTPVRPTDPSQMIVYSAPHL